MSLAMCWGFEVAIQGREVVTTKAQGSPGGDVRREIGSTELNLPHHLSVQLQYANYLPFTIYH